MKEFLTGVEFDELESDINAFIYDATRGCITTAQLTEVLNYITRYIQEQFLPVGSDA